MAVTSDQVAVGTTPVLLTTVESDSQHGAQVLLRNAGSTDVFVGGPGVTTANGLALAAAGTGSPATSHVIPVGPGDALWAVATVSATIHVLRVGV